MTNFENVYNQYFRDIYLFVYALSRNETIAEEITQETFFKALKSIETFKGHCKINVWLCQIAKNTYFSYLEKQRRLGPEPASEPVSKENVEEAILHKEDAFRIHKALHRMNDPYKEVFTLRVFGELSFAQIGQLFEKTESWARVTFYRAKQNIQNALKEESI
ncbi:RNA polymerase sigma factor [Paenibacillus hemerocallicola]|uniref:RNA polymerase sigma factor n=1 Tax=Paenibacillus hemerocallicola TaxID=1172614 RepID=A0A5C4T692_9BACL|nr:RNA polymerase sigma factor [Paenibacillus hemerocallicola]TNJ64346.1 RNA polymerase sigma factor [Paenibacillus hemerocallicola]